MIKPVSSADKIHIASFRQKQKKESFLDKPLVRGDGDTDNVDIKK